MTRAQFWRALAASAGVAALVGITSCGTGSTPGATDASSAQAVTTSAESTAELNADLAQRLDATIEQILADAAIPGAIVGVWGPDGRYVRAFGVADTATQAPMETDFYTRIGSLTKTFTVTGLLQLADQDKLSLDDPIAKYIDGVPEGDKITLRQLAGMQSGLFSYTNNTDWQNALYADPQRAFTPQELLSYAFDKPLSFPPGTDFEYSNTNTVLVGLVVEKVSGQALPDYIRDQITAPLNLQATSLPTDNAFPDPHAQGYTEQTANGAEAIATDWNPSWAWSAGAMISTLEDLHIWAPVLATGKLLTPEMQRQRLTTVTEGGLPQGDGYGLGIFNLSGWIGHNGSLPGYQTVAVYLPPEQRTMVLMINTDVDYQGKEPSTALATAITNVVSPAHVYGGNPAGQPPIVTQSASPSSVPPPAPTTRPR